MLGIQRFSVGIPPPAHRSSSHYNTNKNKKTKRYVSSGQPPPFPIGFRTYSLSMNILLGGFPRSSVEAVLHLERLIAPTKNIGYFSLTPEDIGTLTQVFTENIQARWAFRKLLLRWRIRRCIRINTEDPMTLEPIKEQVEVYDLYNKVIYTFEAKSVARAWKSNLLNHSGVFPDPKFPLNPFTNLPLTSFQLSIAIKLIRKLGYIDWVLDSFATSHYSLEIWKRTFATPLKIQSLASVFSEKSSYDRYDILMDFAELQFEFHGLLFPKKLFQWIFLRHEVSDYENSWIRACKNYYNHKYTLLEKDHFNELDARSSIMNAHLVEVPISVRQIYMKYVERYLIDGSRRVQNRTITGTARATAN